MTWAALSQLPSWLWIVGVAILVMVVYALARMPGNASVEGQLPTAQDPDLKPTSRDRPDIEQDDHDRTGE